MTLTQYLFATGPEGTTLTTGNTGASTVSLSGGTAVFAAAVKGNGSNFGGKFTNALNAQTFARFNANAANNQMSTRARCTLPLSPSNNNLIMARLRSSTATIMSLLYNTSGNLTLNDSTGTGIATLATASQLAAAGITGGSKFEITMVTTSGSATVGVAAVKVYTTGGTQVGTTFTSSTLNLTTGTTSAIDVGVISTNNNAGVAVGWADIQMNDGSSSEVATISAAGSADPTVTVVGNQNVSAGATVNLTSTATPDTGRTITARLWTFDYPTSSLPTLTGATSANATFTAGSAGALYILRETVTDDLGHTAFATTEVRVPLAAGTEVRALTGLTQTVGTWTIVGGGSSHGATVDDELDSTYSEGPVQTGTEASIRYRLQPSAGIPDTITPRLAVDTGTPTVTVRIYEGTTLRQSTTVSPTSSIADAAVTVTSPTKAAIVDLGALWVEEAY